MKEAFSSKDILELGLSPVTESLLSDNELVLLALISQGYTNHEIADVLFSNAKKIKRKVSPLLSKLGLLRVNLVSAHSQPSSEAMSLDTSVFSKTEINVARLISEGYDCPRIAKQLGLNGSYVRDVVSVLMDKIYSDPKDRHRLHLIRDSKAICAGFIFD